MSANAFLKVRALAGGEVYEGTEAGWNEQLLGINFAGRASAPLFSIAAPVEIHSESAVYLGVVQEATAVGITVSVEHKLDRASIEYIERTWGPNAPGRDGEPETARRTNPINSR